MFSLSLNNYLYFHTFDLHVKFKLLMYSPSFQLQATQMSSFCEISL